MTKFEKNNNPKVSIVTVVYNGEKTIGQCLDSVIGQTYENIEYIVIDGNSSDKTVSEIVKRERNISFWSSENDNGIYDAINKGLKKCTGEIIGLINSDDWLEPLAIENIVSCLKPETDFVYGDINIASEDGTVCGKKIAEEPICNALPYRMPFAHQSLYVRRRVFENCGHYSTAYRLSSDLDFVNRICSSGHLGQKMEHVVATFREGGRSGGWETFSETRAIAVKYGMNKYKSYYVFACSILKTQIANMFPARVVQILRKYKKSYLRA